MGTVYIDDDGKEYPENYRDFEDYKIEYESLIERLAKREDAVKMLKIAHPSKIGAVRDWIAQIDKGIKQTEEILEMIKDLHTEKYKYLQGLEETGKLADIINKELRAHVAAHNPEKLEELDAMLSIDEESD